jgi:hypothetical protein
MKQMIKSFNNSRIELTPGRVVATGEVSSERRNVIRHRKLIDDFYDTLKYADALKHEKELECDIYQD